MEKSEIPILVLDDEHFMHRVLTHMLVGLGFESVATFDNAISALDSLVSSQAHPQLILMDLNMPHMDGIEFVRRLAEHGYRGSLVLVSGEPVRVLQMTEKLVKAHQIPVLGHLRKPVSLSALGALLATWQPVKAMQEKAKTYDADAVSRALANGEMVNYYQPKVSVASATLVGVETLVRWRHPTDGVVMPGQFINVAEEHGLIDQLTKTVLSSAMAQAAAWRQAGLRLSVAVNLSMDNLASVDFTDFIVGAAAACGVAPRDVMLELTESKLMLDQRAPLEILARLRIKRFRLSIDDFGTGHSSLSQLRDIAFDELKIDRSFVHGASSDQTTRAMYDASLGLGRQLEMEVVAEGVEDREDWDMVRRTGCDLAQGYFIGPPMPAAHLGAWIGAWKPRAREWRN